MSSAKRISTPLSAATVAGLAAGDRVLLSGVIYTGRDAAHKRLLELIDRGEALPMELRDQVIYFVGPCPAPEGRPIGSAGPTTSYRMDPYSPRLIAATGLRGMIVKSHNYQPIVHPCTQSSWHRRAPGSATALLCHWKCKFRAENLLRVYAGLFSQIKETDRRILQYPYQSVPLRKCRHRFPQLLP